MIKILFVCYGNICRSPMAEFLFKKYVKAKGFADVFYIESAATSSEELGNPVYPPAKKILGDLNIDCSGKRARKLTLNDYDKFDYLIVMDKMNIRDMKNLFIIVRNKITRLYSGHSKLYFTASIMDVK